MSQPPPENSDSQQLNVNPTQRADGSMPQNVIEGDTTQSSGSGER